MANDEITFEFLEKAFEEGGGGIGDILEQLEFKGSLRVLPLKNKPAALLALNYLIEKLEARDLENAVINHRHKYAYNYTARELRDDYDSVRHLLQEGDIRGIKPRIGKMILKVDEILPSTCTIYKSSKINLIDRISATRRKLEGMFHEEIWIFPPSVRKKVKDFVGYAGGTCNGCEYNPCGLLNSVNKQRSISQSIKTIIDDLV